MKVAILNWKFIFSVYDLECEQSEIIAVNLIGLYHFLST